MARALTPSEVSMTSADSLVDPYFAEDTHGVTNVTAQLGLTTYLHCKVNNLNGKTVSQLNHYYSGSSYIGISVSKNFKKSRYLITY